MHSRLDLPLLARIDLVRIPNLEISQGFLL